MQSTVTVSNIDARTKGPTTTNVEVTSSSTTNSQNTSSNTINTETGSNGNDIAVLDTSNNARLEATTTPYNGPVAGIQTQYIAITIDNLNITANGPGWFIHSGPGNDAISVSS